MTDLTPDQSAELEAARRQNGQFGEHDHSGPELELGNAYRDPSSPATVTVRLEQADARDNIFEVGKVEFDARAIFDSRDLAAITTARDFEDLDWVFDTARMHGLVGDHDGPFTVELPEDFDEYIEHRENNGMTEAYESATELLALATMEKRQEVLAEAERLLGIAGKHGIFTKKVSALNAGEVLVQGAQRVTVNGTSESSAMPGFIMVDTDFGYLYLDPEVEVTVEEL